MFELDGVPFKLMRFRYGVGILFVLLKRGPMHLNALRKTLGAEYSPIHNALVFMQDAGLVTPMDVPNSDHIKCAYALTPVGRRYAEMLFRTANDLQSISSGGTATKTPIKAKEPSQGR